MDVRSGFVVVLCLIGLTCAEPIKFVNCGSPSGKVSLVEINPCSSEPCPIQRGEEYKIKVTFNSAVQSKTTTAVVHGIVAGVPVPFPLPNVDGCKSGVQCPVEQEKTYSYETTLRTKPQYPAIKLSVQWELKDDDKKDIFCVKFPVQLV